MDTSHGRNATIQDCQTSMLVERHLQNDSRVRMFSTHENREDVSQADLRHKKC